MVEYRKLHYKLHKQYYIDKAHVRNKRLQIERTHFLIEYLSKHPCVDCGNSNPIVLEFDHKDRKQKEFNISQILTWASMDKIIKEIDKCDIRCANCHKIKTAKERRWLKTLPSF